MAPTRPAYLVLLLCLLLPIPPRTAQAQPTPLGGIPYETGGLEPRTYLMWNKTFEANITALCTLGSDGEALLVAAFNTSGGWWLEALNMSGSTAAATNIRAGFFSEVLPVGDRLAVAANDTLLVLDLNLSVIQEARWPGTRISRLEALDGERFLFLRDRALTCFSLAEMSLCWSRTFENASSLCFCVLPGRGVFVLREEEGWIACSVGPEGGRGADAVVSWLSWAREASLLSYNSTDVLLEAWNESYKALLMVDIGALSPEWAIKIPEGGQEPMVLPDLSGDGLPDVLVWGGTCPRVLSGRDGSPLYSLEGLGPISDAVWQGEYFLTFLVEGNVLLLGFDPGTWGVERYWSLGNTSMMCPLPDLDGDGFSEVAIASGNTLRCFWGHYDDQAPDVEAVGPETGLSTSLTSLILKVRAGDNQSGIKNVVFKVDDQEIQAVLDPISGLYVAEVRFSEGRHIWYAEAEDKVGYRSRTGARVLVVNLSFFGEPGWLDDIIFFSPWVITLVIASALTVRARRKAHPSSART